MIRWRSASHSSGHEFPSTKRIVSEVSKEPLFNDYLRRQEEILSLHHPQWDLTNEEIDSSSDLLKRDGTPICIPPSWDLVQKYVGPDDERADGFDGNIFKKELRLFTGDRSEAEFLEAMRNLKIGGILIGDINSRDLQNANISDDDEFLTTSKTLSNFLKNAGSFQIDFVYFHSSGIFHYEIKTNRKSEDNKQLKRNSDFIKQLFITFCTMYGKKEATKLWETPYFRQSSIFYANESPEKNNMALQGVTNNFEIIWGKRNSVEFWRQEQKSLSSKNLFKDEIYRNFLLFLAGFRPDFFICPVKCALLVNGNLFTHHLNTINYYKDKNIHEDKIQNGAKTATEFLKELKFIRSGDVNFGEHKNVYLTPKQQEAIGFFDDSGNFSPKRQLVVGPPGSGKSLILMLKIFILGQMEERKEKKVYYWSDSGEHRKKLSEFVSRNKSKFCREVKEFDWGEKERVASEGADVILDEEYDGSHALSCLSSQHEDQIVAVVFTGVNGDATSKNNNYAHYSTDVKEFELRGFLITELQTVFRSTRQIQLFFHKFHRDKNKGELISGHNFDGIKVEEWIFDGEEKLKKALEERIQRLIQIEGCEVGEIGLFQPVGYEKPQLINNIFDHYYNLGSLEFPVMIVVEPKKHGIYLCFSRAVCHLIAFTLRH